MNFFSSQLWKSLFKSKPVPPRRPKGRSQMQGEHYDLKTIYDLLNHRYFENKLKLEITWFGSAQRRSAATSKTWTFLL